MIFHPHLLILTRYQLQNKMWPPEILTIVDDLADEVFISTIL